jgi:hypothetical protein
MGTLLHGLLALHHTVAGVVLGSTLKGAPYVVCTFVPVIYIAFILHV